MNKYAAFDMLFLLSFEYEIGVVSFCKSEARQFLIYSLDHKLGGKVWSI